MKRILCPVDFSETSLHAVNYAARLGKAMGADLELLYVQSLWSFSPVEVVRGISMKVEASNSQLKELALEVTRRYQVSCFAEVKVSSALLSSVLHKESSYYNLVVMGSEGERDFLDQMLGSDTYQLIQNSNVPVLLVPHSSTYQVVTNIIYAADYLKDHQIAMTQLIVIAKAIGASIRIVQIVSHGCPSNARHELEEFQRSIKQLYAEDVRIDFEVIQSNDVVEVLNARMKKTDADLLALCTRQHNMMERVFGENIVKEMTEMARYPMLVFHQ